MRLTCADHAAANEKSHRPVKVSGFNLMLVAGADLRLDCSHEVVSGISDACHPSSRRRIEPAHSPTEKQINFRMSALCVCRPPARETSVSFGLKTANLLFFWRDNTASTHDSNRIMMP